VRRILAPSAATASLLILPILLGSTAASADAWARPKPAKACKASSAKPAEVAAVASHSAEFDGKCVRLTGWWRGAAIYPSRAEAAQPDAITMSFLDRRRVGLYLDPKDGREPDEPVFATTVGTVGVCSRWPDDVRLHGEGYCLRKPGPYLAAIRIDPQ
jgi:hypothetical protein